jgi:hypothetical protein
LTVAVQLKRADIDEVDEREHVRRTLGKAHRTWTPAWLSKQKFNNYIEAAEPARGV